MKICRRRILRGSEGKFGTFFRENRAFLSNFYEKLGIFWPLGAKLPQIDENVPLLSLAEYLKNIYHCKIRHCLAVWRQILIFLPKFMKMYHYQSPPPAEYIPLVSSKYNPTNCMPLDILSNRKDAISRRSSLLQSV